MTKLVWSDEYSVGVSELDQDHKIIFRLMNTLVDLGAVASSGEEINDALTAMTEYANGHFEREEEYMRAVGFPDAENHVRGHMVFRENTVNFCLELMDGDGAIPDRVLDYLRHWWVDHILESDMAYKRFVEAKS